MNTIHPVIGDRPLGLASHLRRVSELLTSQAFPYKWSDTTSCNCGLLVRSITGLTKLELYNLLKPMTDARKERGCEQSAEWAGIAADYCPLNPGLPAPALFQKLLDAGLLPEDFGHLERLAHPELRAKMQPRTVTQTVETKVKAGWFRSRIETNRITTTVPIACDIAVDVAQYCRVWAETIEAFHSAPPQSVAAADAQLDQIETRALVS